MSTIPPKELAMCGACGATALLLPVLFHALHLGPIFMPMYLPLVLLGFLVGPIAAAITALLTPLLSGLVTGMPPFYPPIAPVMAAELALMSSLVALVYRRWRANEWGLLLVALIVGRAVNFGSMLGVAALIDLPPAFVAGLSLLSGWPGIVLMMVVIPPLARQFGGHHHAS